MYDNMSGNAYGDPWKYMITRDKAPTQSENNNISPK